MTVTKRALGEGYVAGIGLLFGLILVGQLLVSGTGGVLWSVVLVPAAVLIASVHWVDRLEFDGEQVWTVAVYSACGLGLAAVGVAVIDVLAGPPSLPAVDTVLVATVLGATTAGGALVGAVRELRRSNRRLGLRNAVLHRVLRHNLRNDMTVVLCLLDDLEREADDCQRETIAKVKRKVEALVDTADKVRQVDGTVNGPAPTARQIDLAALLSRRIDRLETEYPSVTLETDLPDCAFVRTGGDFGLVVDNVVECVVQRCEDPELRFVLTTAGGTVRLRIVDRSGCLPDADLSAIASGIETDLEHGFGMELWLVYWLVDASGGTLAVGVDEDDTRYIEIELDCARGRLRSVLA